jgi:hypothetical protein
MQKKKKGRILTRRINGRKREQQKRKAIRISRGSVRRRINEP